MDPSLKPRERSNTLCTLRPSLPSISPITPEVKSLSEILAGAVSLLTIDETKKLKALPAGKSGDKLKLINNMPTWVADIAGSTLPAYPTDNKFYILACKDGCACWVDNTELISCMVSL